MKKKHKNNARPVEIPTFADVALLICPREAPLWLPAHLEWSSQGLRHDRMADEYRPSKAETSSRLKAVGEAARLAQRELNYPAIGNLLRDAKSSQQSFDLGRALKDLAERVDLAQTSSELTTAAGKAKRGRGKPKVSDIFDAKTLCAARVVETLLYFRKKEPGIGNLEAAAIAQAYWLASGGRSEGYGNPLNGWYDYFKLVRTNKNTASLVRLRRLWRRDLEQTERRGRPSWYIGTYFPVPEPQFKSAIKHS